MLIITTNLKRSFGVNSLLLKSYQQRLNHTIAADDLIHKVDFRVGKIVQVEQHPEATHLFIEQGQCFAYKFKLQCYLIYDNHSRFEYKINRNCAKSSHHC
jgi:hypothetical protein